MIDIKFQNNRLELSVSNNYTCLVLCNHVYDKCMTYRCEGKGTRIIVLSNSTNVIMDSSKERLSVETLILPEQT